MTAVTSNEKKGTTYFPDGGWGWAVCFASFMIHVIADGIAYSFGIFVEEFVDYFDCGRGSVGMLGSLMLGVTWCTGPLASILTNKFGCRIVTIAGTLIAFSGFFMSLFAPNIYFMFFSFGIVAGIGLGMAYLPAIVAVSFWFEKRRSLATGLAVCGSGIGTFIFAPLTQIFLTEYGWKGTVLIESAILLNCILCGALFRPVSSEDVSEEKKPLTTISSEVAAPSELLPLNSVSSQVDNLISKNKSVVALSLPDVSQVEGKKNISRRRRAKSECRVGPSEPVVVTTHIRKDAFYPHDLQNIPMYNKDRDEYHRSMVSVNGLPDEKEEDGGCFFWKFCPIGARKECNEMMDITLLLDVAFLLFCISNLLTSIGFCVPYIFLPDRAMKMPWAQGGDEISNKQLSSLLISIVGISNTVGRVIFGWLADRKFVNRLMLYNTVLVLCGIISIASSLCFNYALMAVYSGAFGLFIGVYVCLTPVVLVDLLGLDKLSNAFGVVLLFQGIGAVFGPPIAGAVYDYTDNYDNSFYLMGVCILVSGLMLYPIPCIRRKWGTKDTQRDVDFGKIPASDTKEEFVELSPENVV